MLVVLRYYHPRAANLGEEARVVEHSKVERRRDGGWRSTMKGDAMCGLATWIGAISTATASVIALWLGLRDGFRRRSERNRDARALLAFLSRDLEVIDRCLLDFLRKMDVIGNRDFSVSQEELNEMSRDATSLLDSENLKSRVDHFVLLPKTIAVRLSAIAGRLRLIIEQTERIVVTWGTARQTQQFRDFVGTYVDELIAARADLRPVLEYWKRINDEG